MSLEEIAIVAQLVGAGGVIASMVYLALQIRQSTKVARAETTKDLFLASREALLAIASSKELGKIWFEIRDFENEETGRKYAFYQSFFRLYELQFRLSQQGLLDADIARSYVLIIRVFIGTSYFAEYWQRAHVEYNEKFSAYVDKQIKFVEAEAQEALTQKGH